MTSNRLFGQSLILGLLLAAFGLRLYQVSAVPLNIDEMTTITRYVPLPVPEIFLESTSNNHPFASLLARLFSSQADHLFMMRWPFILLGILSLAFAYRLAMVLFERRVALLTLFLMAVAPVHIGYSVVIRGYIGLILLTTISLYLLWRAWQHNRWRDWLGFGSINILIIYFHLFGVLAAGTQLGLVGLWLLWKTSRGEVAVSEPWLRPRLIRFGLAVLLLAIMYAGLILPRTSSIMATERWSGEFGAWQDEQFSITDDLHPIAIFARLMGPLSPGNIGLFIYWLFGMVGLIVLAQRRWWLAVLGVMGFVLPFVAIFAASQILGPGFYAYVRFLIYLLPFFLMVVALGLTAAADSLSAVLKSRGRVGLFWARTITWGALVGLLLLSAISIRWYLLTATHADWPGLAGTLSANLQADDITICEEYQRGFALPDRAKPHCIWMLDFFVPQLNGRSYTPQFQSSTDFITEITHLQQQRRAMLEPGRVWLVIWQKIPYRPDQLVTDASPPVRPPPPLSAFEPYPAWHFGTATLIQIDTEATLFGNVYESLELLLNVADEPADRARYYRSLANMAAVQGHTQQAQDFFEESWRLVEQAGGQYPAVFLGKTQQAIERIPATDRPTNTAARVDYPFGGALCLQSFEVTPRLLQAGQPLKLDLYWQTLDIIQADYSFFLKLETLAGQTPVQLEFRPFDGTYPTPWWWPGQRLAERHEFLIPPDLEFQDYVVHFGAYDRQQPEEKVTLPLLTMHSQPGASGPAHWLVEIASNPENNCVQPQ